MRTKTIRATSSSLGSMLLTVLILFAFVGALPVARRSTLAVARAGTLNHVLAGDRRGDMLNRRLRAGLSHGDSDEERMNAESIAASVTKLWGEVKPSRQQLEAADELFTALKTQKQSLYFFNNPVFQKWVESVGMLHPGAPASRGQEILDKMAAQYGINALAGMIAVAKRLSDVKAVEIATKLENVQVSSWINQGKNVDDVLHLLRLDEEGSKLLNNRAANVRASFATRLDEARADEMMLASLKKQGFDDADLFHMIHEARRQGGTKALAKRLEEAQFAHWIAKENTVDDVSRLLKLRKQDNFFDQLAVGYWARFATRLGEGHADEMMLASLKTLYGDEYLAPMLKRGRDFGRWKSVASRLEQQLWLSEGLSAEQALKRLMDGGEDIFSEKVSNVWLSYVAKLAKAGENPSKTALSILKGHFTNEWKLAGEMAFGLKEVHGTKRSRTNRDNSSSNGGTRATLSRMYRPS